MYYSICTPPNSQRLIQNLAIMQFELIMQFLQFTKNNYRSMSPRTDSSHWALPGFAEMSFLTVPGRYCKPPMVHHLHLCSTTKENQQHMCFYLSGFIVYVSTSYFPSISNSQTVESQCFLSLIVCFFKEHQGLGALLHMFSSVGNSLTGRVSMLIFGL